MGMRSARVDALTFGLGSGIAGIAGVALSQLTNVGPNLGQAYIVDSFMVVVFGGVGNLWGTLVGGLGLGIANKLMEPWAGAVLAKILVLVFIILFIQKRPRGLFPQKAVLGRRIRHVIESMQSVRCALAVIPGASSHVAARILKGDRGGQVFLLVPATLIAVPLLNALPAEHPLYLSTYTVTLLGQPDLCPAGPSRSRSGLGLPRDPDAGSCRVLCHRRLRNGHVPDASDRRARCVRQCRAAGLHGVPELAGAAWFWQWLRPVLVCRADGDSWLRGCWRLCSAGFAFRSRHRVYLSIITQALTYALMLAFFRNEMGFGGNNGLTDFKDILGFSLQSDSTRAGLFIASGVARPRLPRLSWLVRSRLGRAAVAVRDTEDRTRFIGYKVEHVKLAIFAFSAMPGPGSPAPCTCRRSASSTQVSSPAELDRSGDLGGDGRTRDACMARCSGRSSASTTPRPGSPAHSRGLVVRARWVVRFVTCSCRVASSACGAARRAHHECVARCSA